MGEAVAVDVTVTTRFADPQTLMSAVGSWIERGCLRVPALIECGRTFQIALVTSGGEVAVRGSAEGIRHDGKCTFVRFLSAANDQTDGGVWFDLTDSDVAVPTGLVPAKQRSRSTAGEINTQVGARSLDHDWALGTPIPQPPDDDEHTQTAPPPRAKSGPLRTADGTPSRVPGKLPPPRAKVPDIAPTPAPRKAEALAAPMPQQPATRRAQSPALVPRSQLMATAEPAREPELSDVGAVVEMDAELPPPMVSSQFAVAGLPAMASPPQPMTSPPASGSSPPPMGVETQPPMPQAYPGGRPMTIPPPMVALYATAPGQTGAYYVAPAAWHGAEVDEHGAGMRAPTVPPWSPEQGGAMPSGMWIPIVNPTGVLPPGSVVAPMPQPPPLAPPRPSRGPMMAAVAIAAAGAVVAISAVIWARGAREAPAAPKPAPVAAACKVEPTPAAPTIPAAAAAPATAPTPATATKPATAKTARPAPVVAVAAGAQPVDPVETAAAATGDCSAAFTATATDVQIYIDGHHRGAAPVTLTLPCEATSVTFRHLYRRYVEQTRRITPTPDGAPVHVVMQRPDGLLKVVSRPAGATVSLNGHDLGKTPLVRKVDAFESVTLTVKAPGMAPFRKKIYPKTGTTVIAATLKKKK